MNDDVKSILTTIGAIIGGLGALFAMLSAYVNLGGPIIATQGYVKNEIHTMVCDLLNVRKRVNSIDLYQWEHDNPEPRTHEAQEAVDFLKNRKQQLETAVHDKGCQ